MRRAVYSSKVYNNRIKKLENVKIRIDEIKEKLNRLEKELLEIKILDKMMTLKEKNVNINRKKTIYKVDNIIFLDNLMYQRFPTQRLYTWQEAIDYSNSLEISNYKGWRLPTIDELERLLTKRSLVNSKGYAHFVIRDFLEVLPKDSCFWTQSQENELYVWVVDFSKGYDYWRSKTLKYHALFVHDIENISRIG
ncbi:MAG: DUF1566 domain-containing protein [Sulfurovaceae bacterium]|nr:DUF1566 domain-containing protein [Sulfurovaceae bacterium]